MPKRVIVNGPTTRQAGYKAAMWRKGAATGRIRAFSGKVDAGFPSENATMQEC
jgi:hypothetical protein